jgi:hypothetical protein
MLTYFPPHPHPFRNLCRKEYKKRQAAKGRTNNKFIMPFFHGWENEVQQVKRSLLENIEGANDAATNKAPKRLRIADSEGAKRFCGDANKKFQAAWDVLCSASGSGFDDAASKGEYLKRRIAGTFSEVCSRVICFRKCAHIFILGTDALEFLAAAERRYDKVQMLKCLLYSDTHAIRM